MKKLTTVAIILALLFIFDILFITTSGCTLPIDLVLFETCIFGSFGASVGLTLLAAAAAAIFFGLLKLLLGLMKKSANSAQDDVSKD